MLRSTIGCRPASGLAYGLPSARGAVPDVGPADPSVCVLRRRDRRAVGPDVDQHQIHVGHAALGERLDHRRMPAQHLVGLVVIGDGHRWVFAGRQLGPRRDAVLRQRDRALERRGRPHGSSRRCRPRAAAACPRSARPWRARAGRSPRTASRRWWRARVAPPRPRRGSPAAESGSSGWGAPAGIALDLMWRKALDLAYESPTRLIRLRPMLWSAMPAHYQTIAREPRSESLMRILVIDDDDSVRVGDPAGAAAGGYEVMAAATGQEGAAMLADRVAGRDRARPRPARHRRHGGLPARCARAGDRTPILMLTARDEVEDRVDGLRGRRRRLSGQAVRRRRAAGAAAARSCAATSRASTAGRCVRRARARRRRARRADRRPRGRTDPHRVSAAGAADAQPAPGALVGPDL